MFTLFALLCSRIKLSWLRRLLYCIFSGVLIISDNLGIYITYMYKSNITPAFIITILETTYSEASEYIATYISVINLVSIIIPILVIYGICYLIKS
ncbi:phosphoethanolamine transferase domain-containing protein, partial [Veillonella atypica]|uniref:phosphoethanolamine transferase domain-containing protein n=1 Tax=Veillonella atypica TaxID=39777 RepID=UPI0034E00062